MTERRPPVAAAGAVLLLTLALACAPEAARETPAERVQAGDEERVQWAFLSLEGRPPLECTVLPQKHFQSYIPAIPPPPVTAADFDERMELQRVALGMVEEGNRLFLGALGSAVARLDPALSWQENYDLWLRAGREPGGFLEQLRAARESGEVCPAGACGEDAPPPEGCPHPHWGNARWAPDGSYLGLIYHRIGQEGEEESEADEHDTMIIDFGCGEH